MFVPTQDIPYGVAAVSKSKDVDMVALTPTCTYTFSPLWKPIDSKLPFLYDSPFRPVSGAARVAVIVDVKPLCTYISSGFPSDEIRFVPSYVKPRCPAPTKGDGIAKEVAKTAVLPTN
jgi:hypothetical protein